MCILPLHQGSLPFSSCDKYKRNTKQRRRSCTMLFVDLEKAFHGVPRVVVRWALWKLGVDKWLVRTVMALYTEACTVVIRTWKSALSVPPSSALVTVCKESEWSTSRPTQPPRESEASPVVSLEPSVKER